MGIQITFPETDTASILYNENKSDYNKNGIIGHMLICYLLLLFMFYGFRVTGREFVRYLLLKYVK